MGNKEEAKEIIGEEQAKLTSSRIITELAKLGPIRDLGEMNVSTEKARDIFSEATSLEDLAKKLEEATEGKVTASVLIPHWRKYPRWAKEMNEIRAYLELPKLGFADATAPKQHDTSRPKRSRKKS